MLLASDYREPSDPLAPTILISTGNCSRGYLTQHLINLSYNMSQKKITRKLLKEAISTLTALKSTNTKLNESMPLKEVELYLLDEDGEGVVLCIEYDESTGELHKSFSATDEEIESIFENDDDSEEVTHFEDIPSEKLDEWESEVLKSKGLLN